MDNTSELNKDRIIAKLITKLDQAETELVYLDKILRTVGFCEGIKTLKETVEEVIEEDQLNPSSVYLEGF